MESKFRTILDHLY